VLGPEHPETLGSTANLANYISNQGRYAEAEKIYRETIAAQRRVAPGHPETLRTMGNLANLLADRGQYMEAEKLKRTVLEAYRGTYGAHHPETAVTEYDLACLVARQGRGRSGEAIALLQNALDDGVPAKVGLDIDSDSDLKSLHGDARFEAIVVRAREWARLKMQNER
jgi:tetratricopeptide (TPR) repeat protein